MAALSRERSALSSAGAADGSALWLTLIGIGEDGRDGLSRAAIAALDEAAHVFGGARHLALAAPLKGEAHPWPSPIHDAFAAIAALRSQRVCVLASGDPFHYGVGVQLAQIVPVTEMRVLPQPSAFSLACARLGLAQQDCALVSLHGRELAGIVPHIQPGTTILALSWDGTTPGAIARLLTERGYGGSRLTVLEAMGGPRERVQRAQADGFDLAAIDPLNLVAIEVVAEGDAAPLPRVGGLPDDLFDHDGQLTKAEVRAVTISALAPLAGELLWDVGAGSGSVGIEWCLSHPRNRALAIEAQPARVERIRRNRLALGAVALEVVPGAAPDALNGLPAPDAVFIGGGITGDGVFETCWAALKPGGRLVANVVSLEGEGRLAALFGLHGGDMRRIGISRLDPVGRMHGWRPAMAVTQWVARKTR